MRKLIRNVMTAGLIHASILLNAQTNWSWAVKSSGGAYEEAQDIAADGAGNSYVVGTYQSGSATFGSTTLASIGVTDVFLEKVNSSGAVQWAVRAGGPVGDNGVAVAVNPQGTNIFITGQFLSSMTFYSTNGTTSTITGSSSHDNCFIALYDANGVVQWAVSYGGSDHDRPRDIAISHSSQRVFITGYSTPPTTSNNKLFVACFDYTGAFKWDMNSSNVNATIPWSSIAADGSGNSYALLNYDSGITLPSGTYPGTSGMVLTKIDINGSISWVKNIGSGSGGGESGMEIALDMSNNLYIAGHYTGTASLMSGSLSNAGSGSTTDLFAMKCDNTGTYQWATRIGGIGSESLTGFGATLDGTTYLLARSFGFPTNTVTIGCQTYTTNSVGSTTDHKIVVAELNKYGIITGSAAPLISSSSTIPTGLGIDGLGYPIIAGGMVGTAIFSGTSLSTVSSEDAFVSKAVIWSETPVISSPVTTCVGQSASLSTYAIGGSPTFNWYNSSNVLVGTGSTYVTPVFSSPSSLTYSVNATYPGGCVSAKIPVEAKAIANTTLYASTDQTICAGNCASITYVFSGGTGMAQIAPSTGVSSMGPPIIVCPTTTTEYKLTNALSSQCQIGDKVKITVVSPPAFVGDYKAYVYPTTPCSNTDDEKPTCSTPGCIDPSMPSSTTFTAFQCQIAERAGWQGAGNVGITGFNISGQYTVDVYEADINGNRKVINSITAPSVFLKKGISPDASLVLPFNAAGNGAGFTPTTTINPFTADGTADIDGNNGTGDYFKERYKAAFNSGTLADYSAVIFCVDMIQVPAPGYCTVSKKSYFKIANNGLLNGRGARFASQENGIEEIAVSNLDVFPNPTKGELIIPVTDEGSNVSIRIVDNLGKEVYSSDAIQNGRISIEKLSAGIYFYTVHKNGQEYRGKVVKE